MDQERFDIEKLHKNFEASLKDSHDIIMDFYLEGFKELYKYVQFINCDKISKKIF